MKFFIFDTPTTYNTGLPIDLFMEITKLYPPHTTLESLEPGHVLIKAKLNDDNKLAGWKQLGDYLYQPLKSGQSALANFGAGAGLNFQVGMSNVGNIVFTQGINSKLSTQEKPKTGSQDPIVQKAIKWLGGDDRGMSSEALCYQLVPEVRDLMKSQERIDRKYDNHPHDGADLGRCVRFLEALGDAGMARLGRMGKVSAHWQVLVKNWKELETAYRAELSGQASRSAYGFLNALYTLPKMGSAVKSVKAKTKNNAKPKNNKTSKASSRKMKP